MSLIFTKEFIIDFQNRTWNYPNRKWNYLNRKWNYFTHFQTSDQKLILQNVFHFNQGVHNGFSKQEIELSKQEMQLFKQEMELFHPLPDL